MTERAACPHCPDGHTPPDRGSQPWSAWVAPERDGDGQPMQITVARSAGAHVAESDAQWVRERLNAPAAAVPVSPPVERAALRDRIAAAIWERQNPGRRYADCEYRWKADAEEDADAVLAVLPPPADRAAALREAADIAESLRQFEPATGARKSAQVSENVGILRVVEELRRLAAEAPTTTQPERRKLPPMDPVHILGLYADDEPAAGARQDGAQS